MSMLYNKISINLIRDIEINNILYIFTIISKNVKFK